MSILCTLQMSFFMIIYTFCKSYALIIFITIYINAQVLFCSSYPLMHHFGKTPLISGPIKDALSYGNLKIFSAIDVVESHNLNLYEHEVLACLGENIRRVEFVQGSCALMHKFFF